MNIAYLGKTYSDMEIEKALDQSLTANYSHVPDIKKLTAELIANGYIIGWFQGASEFGPRALGNRSILADPRKPDMKDILNKKVKFREHFRPFAPAVLKEYQSDFFENSIVNPYMLIVKKIKEQKRNIIPAVTHVDGTGRLQTVMAENNPIFYKLIVEFYEITGVPVLLNTSFNIKGEPIVETPDDAIKCFNKTEIDFLCIGNFIAGKKHICFPKGE